MNLFETLQVFGGNAWLYGGTFVLVLSILVFVHEWGHYIVARMCGVRVEAFSIGFGKELFGYNDKHGTRWKVSLIPLGGYVKMFGDTDPASAVHSDEVSDQVTGQIRHMTDEEKKVAFFAMPVWKRSLIVFAGPAINYLFAILLFAGLYIWEGRPVTPPMAGAVMSDSAAYKSGFQPHDEIVSIDGIAIASFEDIMRTMLVSLDAEKTFVVRRDGKEVELKATPARLEMEDRFGFKSTRGLLGLISPRRAIQIEYIKKVDGKTYDTVDAVRAALVANLDKTIEIAMGDDDTDSERMVIKPLSVMNKGLGDKNSEEYGLLYIASERGAEEYVHYNPAQALVEAVKEAVSITTSTFEALWQMIRGVRSPTELGGVIRIGALAGDVAQQGIIALIVFSAMLSINLGFINLVPIPLLDGGHLLFYAFEALLGRPIPERVQEFAFQIGMVFLVFIMVFANLNDLVQLIL